MEKFVIENNGKHLKERLRERYNIKEDGANKIINEVKKIIEENTPDDWRFTVSPSATFIIAYLGIANFKSVDIRFLGKSYRDLIENGKKIGEEIEKKLKKDSLTSDELKDIAEEYKKVLFSPECQIFHILKTVFAPEYVIPLEEKIFEKTKETVPHIIPISARKIARCPNALIINGELWVRQGEYFDLSMREAEYKEYLIFQKLTKEGITESKISIYTLNKYGVLEYREEINGEIRKIPRLKMSEKYGRSQSYWTLPTYIDSVYMDLKYKMEHWEGDDKIFLSKESTLLLFRIEKLLEIVKKEVEEDWKKSKVSIKKLF
jgi:hypothetical protein